MSDYNIPPFIDGTTPTNARLQPKVVKARTLVGRRIEIVEVRLDQPAKYHQKVDMYLFKDSDGTLCAFFNGILKRWGIKAGDSIVLQFITNPGGVPHYEPVEINAKTQKSTPKPQSAATQQSPHGLNKELVIKLAAESPSVDEFYLKINPHLSGTRYDIMHMTEEQRHAVMVEIYQRYRPASQPNAKP